MGHAVQAEYDPFANPERARREEFGDLLAEGLYALIGEKDPSRAVRRATSRSNADRTGRDSSMPGTRQ